MRHECEKMHDSVEIATSFYSDVWVMVSDFAGYADFGEEDYYKIRHETLIEYCPFCGKKLKGDEQ